MDSPDSSPLPAGWFRQLGFRLRTYWALKMIGTMLGMGVFFVAYFRVLHHPVFPVTVMPLIAPDRWIGFRPEALPLYLSLWFYVSLAPALLVDRRELAVHAAAAAVLGIVGLGIFFFWPTTVPRLEVDWTEHSAYRFLQSIDASGNACPSLHVAFAVFTAAAFERLLQQVSAGPFIRAVNWLWCAGILYSTVAIRQHVAIDVLAGTVLGLGVAGLHRWALRTFPRAGAQ